MTHLLNAWSTRVLSQLSLSHFKPTNNRFHITVCCIIFYTSMIILLSQNHRKTIRIVKRCLMKISFLWLLLFAKQCAWCILCEGRRGSIDSRYSLLYFSVCIGEKSSIGLQSKLNNHEEHFTDSTYNPMKFILQY